MDCCKEKDCCPCAERIECLQAQIHQMAYKTGLEDGRLALAMKTLLAVPMVKNFLPEEELDKITELLTELSTD